MESFDYAVGFREGRAIGVKATEERYAKLKAAVEHLVSPYEDRIECEIGPTMASRTAWLSRRIVKLREALASLEKTDD